MSRPMPTHGRATEVWLKPVFIAKAGREAELQEALRSLQTLSRNDPGCLEYTVFSDGERPGTFVLFEGWVSREDLEAHNQEVHVTAFVEAVEPLLAKPFTVTPLVPLVISPRTP